MRVREALTSPAGDGNPSSPALFWPASRPGTQRRSLITVETSVIEAVPGTATRAKAPVDQPPFPRSV